MQVRNGYISYMYVRQLLKPQCNFNLVNRNGHQLGKLRYWDHELANWFLMWCPNQFTSEEQRILSEGNNILYFTVFLFFKNEFEIVDISTLHWQDYCRLVITFLRNLNKIMRRNFAGSTNFCGFRDQNSHRSWDLQGSNFWLKIRDELWKHISRYDPVQWYSSKNG